MRLSTHKYFRGHYIYGIALGGISLASISIHPDLCVFAPAIAQTMTSQQYIVYTPSAASLQRARTFAPDAFVSRLDTGEQVVQLGRFNNLNLAEQRAASLQQSGLVIQIRPTAGRVSTLPAPVSNLPAIPNSQPITTLPAPVNAIPISREPLPGVPGSDFPSSNTIEIVRSPQPAQMPPAQPTSPIAVQPIQPIAAAQPQPPSGSQLRYFVIIPTGQVSELQRVQAIAPNAQLRSSFRGTYIEIQGYPDRGSAETMNSTIRRQGFDSRVVFF
jgi:hypothetical protein